MSLQIVDMPLSEYWQPIERGDPYGLSRYGDGEWACLLGKTGKNRDGVRFDGSLRSELERCLCEGGDYVTAHRPRRRMDQARQWAEVRGLSLIGPDAAQLGHASADGELEPFWAALRRRRVMTIGPPHLTGLPRSFLPTVAHLSVSESNAFDEVFHIFSGARFVAGEQGAEVLLIAAGPAACVLVHELRRAMPDRWAIDIGAILDPYCGVQSRRCHRRMMGGAA